MGCSTEGGCLPPPDVVAEDRGLAYCFDLPLELPRRRGSVSPVPRMLWKFLFVKWRAWAAESND